MKKVLGLVLALSAAASMTAAATTQETINALMAQIAALQAQLNNGTTATTTTAGTTKTYVYSRLLKVGKRGNDVKELQTCLNRLGNNTGVADGIFGRNTKAGVKSFQAANGLAVDGIIGRMTGPKFEAACMVGGTTTTTTTTTTTGTGVTGDKLVVSGVASDDMIVGTNQTVVFAKLKLEAGDENVKVRKINVKYTGTANANSISKIVLLDSAMLEIDTDGLDSSDEATLRADLTVKDGESVTVYVAAKTAGTFSTQGLDGMLKVTSVTTDGADVEGDSVMGANHTFNAGVTTDTFKATLDIDETGSVKIGENSVKAATINVENNSSSDDEQIVKSIKITRVGTSADDSIDNVKIKVAGETYTATQDNEEYTFDFGTGVKLAENGDDEDFVVYTDVEDDATRTFAFYMSDIVVVDADGVILSENTMTDTKTEAGLTTLTNTVNGIYDNWEDTGLATIALSEVVISKTTDVQSDKVSAGQDAAELASFDVEVTGKDVEGDVQVKIEVSNVDLENGIATAGTVDAKDVDLDNVAIYTKSGSKISDKEDTSFTVVGDATDDDKLTYVVTFDNVRFEEGDDAVDYVIKADINRDAPDSTRYEVKEIKYVSVEDVDGENIADITETIASPAQIEVEGAVVAVSVEAADDTDLNSDTDDQEVAQIKIDASNSGDDIKVTRIKVNFAVNTTATVANGGDAAVAPEAVISDLKNCELFDGTTSVSNKEDGSSSVTFDIDDLVITKDTEKNLSVRCDVKSNFENADVITVTGVSFDAEGVNTKTTLDDNTGFGSTTATVTTGTVTFKISTADSNDDKVVKDDANDVVLGEYEFKAKDAELTLDDVTVTFNKDVSSIIDGKVDIYINGTKEDSENATTTAAFTNLSKTVAKDETVTITIKADVKLADAGIQIISMAPTTEEGVAVTAVTGTAGAGNADSAPFVTIVTALPVITKVNVDSTNLETANDVTLFAYKVKAEGGDVTLGSTLLTATLNNVTLANAKVKVYDNSAMSGSAEAEVAFTSGAAVVLNTLIAENDTYYVFVVADVDVTNDARSIRVQMNDDATGAVFTTPALTGDKIMEDDMKSLLKKD